jgi:hypothetical protein
LVAVEVFEPQKMVRQASLRLDAQADTYITPALLGTTFANMELFPCLAYFPTLKLEVIYFSETSGCIQTT